MGTSTAPAEKLTSDQQLPSGPIWAGILASGIGCVALGALVDVSEASKAVSKALTFYKPTGDLSGKTIIAIVIWIAAWAALHARWKRRDIHSPRTVLTVTFLLILLAVIAVFPPFFELFAAN